MRVACLLTVLFLPVLADGQTASAWPEADRLFRSDPRWLGSDGAFSVDLGNRRVLWLFGDTFVAKAPGIARSQSQFLHNSVAIESGYDPSRATMTFFEGQQNGRVTDFISATGKTWLWPLHGVKLDNRLLLFFARIEPDTRPNSLGFQTIGWAAYLVDNPDDVPSRWVLQGLHGPEQQSSLLVGTSVIRLSDEIYAFALDDTTHDAYLLRWSVPNAKQGFLSTPQWWRGSSDGWKQTESGREAIIRNAGSEFSVQRAPDGKGFVEIESAGFGATNIVWRHAAHLEGPWSEPRLLYRPPENATKGSSTYAAKSHPELFGGALVITYATNGPPDRLLTDMTIGYPRFVRVSFGREIDQR